jgi:hypothetical protein
VIQKVERLSVEEQDDLAGLFDSLVEGRQSIIERCIGI